ncbi:hypothetical protein QL285_009214 [Trifolium repens]|nr:hypothetical protein QL285_009214 [Trifolium repens]
MKTKTLIFMLFLCAQILISVVTIELSKDEKQFGVREESKTKIGINGLSKHFWSGGRRPKNSKGKKGEQDPVGSSSGGNNGEGSAQPESVENGSEIKVETGPDE